MEEIRIVSWNDLSDQLYAGAWQETIGRFRSTANFIYSAKLFLRYLADRLRYRRGTRLMMGNALICGALALALSLAHFEWFGVLHVLPAIFPFVLGALALEMIYSGITGKI